MSDNGAAKVSIDRFWLSIGLPLIGMIFIGGMGWRDLSLAHENINKLEIKLENIESNKYGDRARLIIIETKLNVMEKSMEKMLNQLEVLTKRAPVVGSRI